MKYYLKAIIYSIIALLSFYVSLFLNLYIYSKFYDFIPDIPSVAFGLLFGFASLVLLDYFEKLFIEKECK